MENINYMNKIEVISIERNLTEKVLSSNIPALKNVSKRILRENSETDYGDIAYKDCSQWPD